MSILAAAFLIGSGMYLNSQDKIKTPDKQPVIVEPTGPADREEPKSERERRLEEIKANLSDPVDQSNGNKVFRLQFFKKKEITNPGFDESLLWRDLDNGTMNQIKARVDLSRPNRDSKINDVGFDSHNIDTYNSNQALPAIDDKDRDDQFIHNNMVPFFGSTVKQNTNDTAMTQHILEAYTGNFRHTRRDNKTEVEYLFDPTPNNQLVYGANSNAATNRDQTRFFPSATGKKHNELPFEQINVGKGIANGYTARPSGGFHQDVRILPKTTEELQVNPRITYEGRVISGKAPTEKGTLMGRQTLKKPKAIVYNWNGERNFTGLSVHKKNKQRPDIIFKCTNRDKLHREYKGIAAPTTSSKNVPDCLRGKKKLGTKRNFIWDWIRNLGQVEGGKINDFSKSGFENRPTERSMTGTRTHYTNVHQVGGSRGQQRSFNQNGLRYTKKQDLIANRPGGDGSCGNDFSGGKAGPTQTTRGPVYDRNQTAKVTVRETTENNRHHGFMGKHELKGPTYDQNQTAKVTVRETTENNRHHGFMGKHELKGPTYDQNQTAKVTVRETTENNRHHGFMGKHELKGPTYDQNQTAKVTVRETTENNRHHGFMGKHELKGPTYDQSQTAKVTVKETTENNRHHGFMDGGGFSRRGPAYDQSQTAKVTVKETTENNRHHGFVDGGGFTRRGPAYDQSQTAKVTVKETTEDNRHHGFVGKHKLKGPAYDQSQTAKVTIKETTENNNYITGVGRGALQNGGGYATTKWEAKNPQKAYLCDNEYVGAGEATTNKKPKTYSGEYRVNTNKEQIAVGRAPNEVKNFIAAGKEGYNICVNKLDLDREVPHILGKGTNTGNMYADCINLTTRKNVTPTQVDRLHVDTLDQVKCNPLHINQNLN